MIESQAESNFREAYAQMDSMMEKMKALVL